MSSEDFKDIPTKVDDFAMIRAKREHEYWRRVQFYREWWGIDELHAQWAENTPAPIPFSEDFSDGQVTVEVKRP